MNTHEDSILPTIRDGQLALASVACADGPRLCVLDANGALRPVGAHRDVAELLADGEVASLEEAVAAAGVAEQPLAERTGEATLAAPVRPAEVLAAGVTYERSRDARMHEAPDHQDAYDRIYVAERPELFLKATGPRVRGPGETIGLRADSAWQVPEPELGLVLSRSGDVLGYVLGDDVSSRDIEGANALYLPQAKIFAGSCALGPVVLSAASIDAAALTIELQIVRAGRELYAGRVPVAGLRRSPEELAGWLARENWLAPGTVLLTGTGIVPDDDVSLEAGDEVRIGAQGLGMLVNLCAAATDIAPPEAWRAQAA